MKLTKVIVLCYLLGLISLESASGQDLTVKLGANEIGLNQYFTVSVVLENDNIRQHTPFPDIDGFVKRGTSSSSSTSFINGKISSSHTITQNYQPTEKGKFVLRPFKMEVNNKEVSSSGLQINVGEPVQARRQSAFDDPFGSFFGRADEPTEYIDVKADAFLSLNTSKNEVYVGEGFTATLAFYVSDANRADMRFYDLGKQVTEIVKQIKPERCWEENFNIEQINGEPITVNGKRFTRYTIYQAAFFPLNVEDISFPSVTLDLIKYKVAKNPSFFGQNRQEDFEKFRSQPKTVKVKELPPHPLRESVSVGQYQLRERLDKATLETGQSINYSFDVVGTGNISAINEPVLPEDDNFDFYAPNTRQSVNRANARISGNKSFNYYGIPNEPGTYNLGDYFSWVFFNPQTAKYDTLKSELTLNITGESRKNEYILSNDVGSFYDRINNEDNTLRSADGMSWFKWLVNGFIVLILAATAFIIFKKV
jgi:hypothetical protein